MKPSQSTYSLGLCGFPLGHSLSPVLHEKALQISGLEGSYTLYPIPPQPDSLQRLALMTDKLRSGELQGLNVTIPHKQTILSLLDDLSPTAQAIGAVNNVYCENGRLIGENTDAPGFLTDLINLPLNADKRAIVLGAGGAARAVVYALIQTGWHVHIAARRVEQAVELAQALSGSFPTGADYMISSHLDQTTLQKNLKNCSLIINATPVGMEPHVNENPWLENLPLPDGICVYDLIYNPPETRFMRTARLAGIPARNGIGLLVEQAALSFKKWTGVTVSSAEMACGLPEIYQDDFRRQS